jgi:hypothetical protein
MTDLPMDDPGEMRRTRAPHGRESAPALRVPPELAQKRSSSNGGRSAAEHARNNGKRTASLLNSDYSQLAVANAEDLQRRVRMIMVIGRIGASQE